MGEEKCSYINADIVFEDGEEIKCDKCDCLIAVFAGVCAGVIDVFFVGSPGFSKTQPLTDKMMDSVVMKFAKIVGWNPKEEQKGNIASAIGFLERKYTVNYDQSKKIQVGQKFQLDTKNHHLKSLSHSPDIIGLFFAILNQFTNTSSFVSNGRIITIKNEETYCELQGHTFISKLYCGFCNWLGHVMSDIAGSSARGGENSGRGMGLPVPFMELFQLCDFGKLQGRNGETVTLARVMEQVFTQGYDSRFAMSLAIPCVLEEFMIQVFWVIKRRFYYKKAWNEAIPNKSHSDLRVMRLLGNATLCLIDGVDAFIRSKGNAFAFIMRINIIAWCKLIVLALLEIKLRYGDEIAQKILKSCKEWISWDVIKYYNLMEARELEIKAQFKEFLNEQEQEYMEIMNAVEGYSFITSTPEQQVLAAQNVACKIGVPEKKIGIIDDLDEYFKSLE